ncbi:hypothetical protein E2C01_038429 [Portunus trituberculatus]|uniref:Uncharacterized protein n=1 Tax=Portunus trituberculatus TaxID=210409 RepID=A0A5B7FAT1_PORTR|nr:hypothetical protein [Portunus trituberculatus]
MGGTSTHRDIQVILQDVLKAENNDNWLKLITNVYDIYKDPKIFWEKVKTITGNNTPQPHYLINNSNVRKYTNEDKENIHREYWIEVFNNDNEEEDGNEENTELNNYENTWKIKTNLTKFTPIHLGAKKTTPLNINEEIIEFKNNGKCLGHKMTSTGYYKHIE